MSTLPCFGEGEAALKVSGTKSKEVAIIFSEDFEGEFPGTAWVVGDSISTSGLDYWDTTSYKSHNDSKSCWCAQVGNNSDDGNPNADNHYYDNDMSAYMDLDVDLSGYESATFSFWYWLELEYDYYYYYDALYVNTSDGASWTNQAFGCGISSDWETYSFELPLDTVTIRFEFVSDYSNEGIWDGVYIDDILITGVPTAEPTTGEIAGTVSCDGCLASDATITAYYAGNLTEAATDVTDEYGEYHIPDLSPGTYKVTASKLGYLSATETVLVTAGNTTYQNFTLTEASTTGNISGHVYIHGTTTPIQGVTVSTDTGGYSTITGTDGDYTLSNVTVGTYNLTTSKSSYQSASENVTVTAGNTTTQNFYLTQITTTGTLTGHVYVHGTTTPIQGATVSADLGGYNTTTDADGSYTLSNVTASTYKLTVSKSGYQSASVNVTVSAGSVTTQDFKLNSTSEATRCIITGTVKDDNGNPVAGAKVEVRYAANNTLAGSTYTNATGGYTISTLSPGSYTLNVSKSGFVDYETSVTVTSGQTTTKQVSLTATQPGDGTDDGTSNGIGDGTIGDGKATPSATVGSYWWLILIVVIIIVAVAVVTKLRKPSAPRARAPTAPEAPSVAERPVVTEQQPREEAAPPAKKRFCIKCGKQISESASFCPFCGCRF